MGTVPALEANHVEQLTVGLTQGYTTAIVKGAQRDH